MQGFRGIQHQAAPCKKSIFSISRTRIGKTQMNNEPPTTPIFDDSTGLEIEALSRMFDYLLESLSDAGSEKAVFAVKAAKSVMLNEFTGKEI